MIVLGVTGGYKSSEGPSVSGSPSDGSHRSPIEGFQVTLLS